METRYFLALDYGTQSVRAVLFDQFGRILDKSQLAVEPFIKNQQGAAEQLPEYCYSKLVEVVKELLKKTTIAAAKITCVSLTTLRASSVLLDENAEPISPIYMWSDTRLATNHKLQPMSWHFRLAFKLACMSKRIRYLRRAAKVNYLAECQPDLLKSADKVALFSGYLLHKITGKLLDSVASQVAYLPFEYKTKSWAAPSSWRWQALACTQQQMMPLVPPAEDIGSISVQFAQDTGLSETTMVATAGGDKACEMFATGSGQQGIANISLGSAASISIGLPKYQESFRYMPSFPSLAENEFMNEIQLERGFWLLTWLIDEFGHEEKMRAQQQGISTEAYICQQIQHIEPGSDGLLLSPTWSQGVIFPGPEARGSIIGFTPKHSRLHMFRAAIEGILFTLKAALLRLEKKHNFPVKIVRVSGGGSQSEQILQMAADIFERPVETIDVCEASALGAAMCAAVATKTHANLSQAREAMMKVDKRFYPRADMSKKYQRVFKQHARLYDKVKPIFKEIGEE
ncbi:MAG: FGGY-family carbohydrate kinase [Parashewanella sp.]